MSKASELISAWEGYEAKSYKCPAGVWTVGYGCTGKDIVEGVTWTKEQAVADLELKIKEIEEQIKKVVKVSLNGNQLAALTSFVYNVGIGAFKKSTLLKKLNVRGPEWAAPEFLAWNKAGGKISKGLVNRRKAEMDLFLS